MASKTEAFHLARREASQKAQGMQFSGEKPSITLYGGVTLVALLKDLLDFVGVGSLPAIGTVVTFCFTFLIWVFLYTFDHSGGSNNTKAMRGLILSIIAIVEGLGFGLNFLPIETLSVILLYFVARKAWKKSKRENTTSSGL